MAKTLKIGSVVTKVALQNRYWRGAYHELVCLGYALIDGSRSYKRGDRIRFTILGVLPDPADFKKDVDKKLYTRPLGDLLVDAISELESLTEEMGEWRDNMEMGGLDSTMKFGEVQECADALDYYDVPDPDDLSEAVRAVRITVNPMAMVVSYPYRHKKPRTGRSYRASEVAYIFGIVADALERDDLPGRAPDEKKASAGRKRQSIDLGEEMAIELRQIADEIGSLDFPGMF